MSNHLISRFLNNPLTFTPGKFKESDQNNFNLDNLIVLSNSSNNKISQSSPTNITKPSSQPEMKKPKSMAEAVAAYTGKKFLSKREKKRLHLIEKPNLKPLQDDGAEDFGEELDDNDDEGAESNYESAEEEFNHSLIHPTNLLINEVDTSSSLPNKFSEDVTQKDPVGSGDDHPELAGDSILANSINPDNEDDDEEEDEDFNDEKQSTSDGSDDELSSELNEEDENLGESSDNLEQLKSDLKQDAYKQEEINQKQISEHTPPTSIEDEDEESDYDSKQIIDLSEFYNINENYEDKGTKLNSKIFKNWRELSNKSSPIGLLNHGVTCYMNSAIQSMIHIPAMQHYLNDINNGKYQSILKPRSVSHTLAELSKKMWENHGSKAKYINPKRIISRLSDINCLMSEWQQEDSHEYFMSLLSRLQEDSTPKGQKLNQSIIYDIFGGLLLQKITCTNCKNVSKTNQEFYDLSLGFNKKRHNQIEAIIDSSNNTPPPMPGKYTIEKSIKDFFSSELIKLDKNDSQSGYTCESCHQKTMASKISYINESPETLTIHLKRFKFNGNSSSKVKQSISYSNYLDLTKYTINGEPTKYRLISVIVHEGRSLSSGHYIAHCLQPDGSWCTYDDEYINKIPEHTALSDPAAYVLIYTKLTPKNSTKRVNDDKSNDKPIKKRRVNN